MTGLKSAFAAIHRTNAEPELKFAAAMVAAAAEDARLGDCTAYAWLTRCSLRWLCAIVPTEDDCQRILDQLLRTVPAPADCPDVGTIQPSETAPFIQRLLPGLEMEAPHDNGRGLPTMRIRTRDPTPRNPDWRVAQAPMPGLRPTAR